MSKIRVLFGFLYFRSIVYFLSFVSYNSKLFNIFKFYSILKKKLLKNYIEIYLLNIILFITILILMVLGTIYIHIKLKKSVGNSITIKSIRKNVPDLQISYIGTYLLPLIASFYKLNIFWLICYEIFILSIYFKNRNYHYKILLGFLFKSYTIIDKNKIEYILLTNKQEKDIEKNRNYSVSVVNFGDEYIAEIILYLK